MPDHKKTGNNSQGGKPLGPRGIAKLFSGLASQAQEAIKDIEGLEQYEELIETQKTLKKDLEEARFQLVQRDGQVKKMTDEIQDQKRKSDILLNSFGEKFRELHGKEEHISCLEEENSTLEGELQSARDEATKLSETITGLQETIDRQEKSLQRAKEKVLRLSQMCEEQERALSDRDSLVYGLENECQELRGDVGYNIFKDVPMSHIERQATEMANDLHGLVVQFMLDAKDISKVALDNLACQRSHALKLSKATTKCAKLLRCAAAEAVICDALTRHVFRDLYYPGIPRFGDAMSAIIDLLGEKPDDASSILSSDSNSNPQKVPRRQMVVRAQLLAHQEADCPNIGLMHKEVVAVVLEEISPILNPFLSATAILDFRNKLGDFLLRVTQFWAEVQRNPRRYTVYSGRDYLLEWDEEEDQHADYHSSIEKSAELEAMREQKFKTDDMDVIAVLFPQVICEGARIFKGRALFSTHRAVVKASMERSREQVPTTRVPIAGHKRRSSVVSASSGAVCSPGTNLNGTVSSSVMATSPASPRNTSPAGPAHGHVGLSSAERHRAVHTQDNATSTVACGKPPLFAEEKGNGRPSGM